MYDDKSKKINDTPKYKKIKKHRRPMKTSTPQLHRSNSQLSLFLNVHDEQ